MRQKTGRQSEVLQARLRRDDERQLKAIEIWGKRLAAGQSARDIMTQALLKLDGVPLAKLKDTDRIDNIKELVIQGFTEVLREMRNADREGFRRFAEADDSNENDMEFSDQFIENAQKSVRKSFRQQKGDRG